MKHLLSTGDLDLATSLEILNLAVEMQGVNSRDIKKLPALTGRTVANLFFEDSTRTRFSFEIAAKRLSADVVNFTAKGSSVSKGESLKDTILTLEAMGIEALVVRHHHSGAANTIANASWSKATVLSAGDQEALAIVQLTQSLMLPGLRQRLSTQEMEHTSIQLKL